jgi:MFS transporter, FHS family, Na+ dependent glucose transporter 1
MRFLTVLDAVRRDPARRGKLAITLGYYAVFSIVGLITAGIGPALPDLATRTKTKLGEIGALISARSFGFLVGSLRVGRVFDRFPGHIAFFAILFSVSALLVAVPYVRNIWILAGVVFLVGVGQGSATVGCNTLIMRVHERRVGPLLNGLHFSFGVGAFVSPLVAGAVAERTGEAVWIFPVLAAAAAPVAFFLLKFPSPTVGRRVEKSDATPETRRGLLALLVAFFVIYVGAEASWGNWVYSYALEANVADRAEAAYLNSAFWGMLTFGRLAVIPAASRVAPRKMLALALGGAVVAGSIGSLWHDSAFAAWLSTLLMGFSMAPVFPTMLSFAERRMTLDARITGFFFAGASAGSVATPWAIGQLMDAYGPAMMPTVVLVAVSLALLTLGVVTNYSRRMERA